MPTSAAPSPAPTRTPNAPSPSPGPWSGSAYKAPVFDFFHTGECYDDGDGTYSTYYYWQVTGVFYEISWTNGFTTKETNRKIGYYGESPELEGESIVDLPKGPNTATARLEITHRDPRTGQVLKAIDSQKFTVVCG